MPLASQVGATWWDLDFKLWDVQYLLVAPELDWIMGYRIGIFRELETWCGIYLHNLVTEGLGVNIKKNSVSHSKISYSN